jgi:hypothetical protein
VGERGDRQQRERAGVEHAAQLRPAGVVLCLTCAAVAQVRERLGQRQLAGLLAREELADRVRAVAAESSGAVEREEALALALARAGRVARLALRQPERGSDRPPGASVGEQREHAALGLRELGEELPDDQVVLVGDQRPLGLLPPRPLPARGVHGRRCLLKCMGARSTVAVQTQRAHPQSL